MSEHSAPSLRVVIADDHAPIRAGVRHSLEVGGFEVVGEASNARAAVELAVATQRDVCHYGRRHRIARCPRGLSTEEAAARLFVSPGTVRVHVSNVVKKLRAPNRKVAIKMLDER